MKTLENHKLLIDKECPMCQLYGNAFEKFNIVENGTCLPFQDAKVFLGEEVDEFRAQNEIALINTKTSEVVYGIDALKKVIGYNHPALVTLIEKKWVNKALRILYKFISQNRKIIAPSKLSTSVCRPTLDLKFRLVYMVLVAVLSSIVIFKYSVDINTFLSLESNYNRELIICFGQIAWQYLFLNGYLKEKKWEYLGNMSTVSLIGTLLLIPMMWISFEFVGFKIAWFVIVVGIMFFEHLRRTKLLEINYFATISWLCFRVFALYVILLYS